MDSSKKITVINSVKETYQVLNRLGLKIRILVFSAIFLVTANIANFFATHLFLVLVRCLGGMNQSGPFSKKFATLFADPATMMQTVVACMVLAKILSAFSNYASALLLERENEEIYTQVKSRIFSKLMSFGKAYHDKNSTAKTNGIILEASEKSAERLTAFHTLLSSVLKLMVILIILFGISWIPAVMVLVSVLTTIFAAVKSQAYSRKLSTRIKAWGENLEEKMLTLLTAYPLLKLLNTTERETRRFSRLANRSAYFNMRRFKLERYLGFIGEGSFLSLTLLLAAITPWLLRSGNENTISTILTFFLIMRPIESTVLKLSRSISQLTRSSGVFHAIEQILNIDGQTYLVWSGKKQFNRLKTEIEFRSLTYVYSFDKNRTILNNLSFKIGVGEWVSMMGTNGSGKSTLVHLLSRMYRIDKECIFINGIPIEKWDVDSLRAGMAVVSQQSIFLDGSISNALTYGLKVQPSQDELVKCMKKVGLHQWVAGLPHGYNCRIGSDGIQLSGGERQKLALARAFLSTAKILILDEATSALDVDSQKLIMAELHKLRGKKTIFMITHDSNEATQADRMLTLTSDGVIETVTTTRLETVT